MLIGECADNLTIDNAAVEAWLERRMPHVLSWWREYMAKPFTCLRCGGENVTIARGQDRPAVRDDGAVDVYTCGGCGAEWYGWNPPGQELQSQRLARLIRFMVWTDYQP